MLFNRPDRVDLTSSIAPSNLSFYIVNAPSYSNHSNLAYLFDKFDFN